MLLRQLLTEAPKFGADDLAAFKAALAGKIKSLPSDDATLKALKEIEDLLKNVHAGGKMGIINGELQRIEDPTVTAHQKILARYIMSLDMTPEQRNELFTLWKTDKLVDRKKLLTVGKHSFDQIINKYNSNPVIKELVNELMRMSTLGQGKGEFGLSVLSKNINKPEGKGDLLIDGKKIEAKTTDGGAGRFTDQEVRPGEGFEAAARALNAFVQTQGISFPTSGVSITLACQIPELLEKKEQAQYFKLVDKVVNIIFDNKISTKGFMDAVKSGNSGAALQEYAKANFDFYMSMKDDEGVLYINLTKDPIATIFFRTADELTKNSLRFHAGTAYLTSIKDARLIYPQIEIVDTTFGANARAKAEKAAAKAAKATVPSSKKIVPKDKPALTKTSTTRQLK